jgi:GTP-binding protein
MHANFITSAAAAGGFPDDEGGEVVFAGRSNSGKSSAINRITGRSRLARVSKTPGRTQLINFFELGPGRRLVDLPGYGFARVPDHVREEWRRLVDVYFTGRRSIAGLFLTVDIRRALKQGDMTLLDMASDLAIPVTILLTKSDKLSRGRASTRELELRQSVGDAAGVIRFSALDGTGVEAARARLSEWLGMPSAA